MPQFLLAPTCIKCKKTDNCLNQNFKSYRCSKCKELIGTLCPQCASEYKCKKCGGAPEYQPSTQSDRFHGCLISEKEARKIKEFEGRSNPLTPMNKEDRDEAERKIVESLPIEYANELRATLRHRNEELNLPIPDWMQDPEKIDDSNISIIYKENNLEPEFFTRDRTKYVLGNNDHAMSRSSIVPAFVEMWANLRKLGNMSFEEAYNILIEAFPPTIRGSRNSKEQIIYRERKWCKRCNNYREIHVGNHIFYVNANIWTKDKFNNFLENARKLADNNSQLKITIFV